VVGAVIRQDPLSGHLFVFRSRVGDRAGQNGHFQDRLVAAAARWEEIGREACGRNLPKKILYRAKLVVRMTVLCIGREAVLVGVVPCGGRGRLARGRKRCARMPKMKTNKAVAKRIKVTGTGKLVRHRPMGGHLKSRKSPKRIRGLRQRRLVSRGFSRVARKLLGIGNKGR
jgi:large subunit ribosomal protein L35